MGDDRILSTHTGSLPRPDDLIRIMWAVGDGIPVDQVALAARVADNPGRRKRSAPACTGPITVRQVDCPDLAMGRHTVVAEPPGSLYR